MMVADFSCWRQNNYVGDRFRFDGDIRNVKNRSLVSQTCHQHKRCPTCVTMVL